MASPMRMLTAFARSRRGQRLTSWAAARVKATASRPENRRRIEQLRRRLNQATRGR